MRAFARQKKSLDLLVWLGVDLPDRLLGAVFTKWSMPLGDSLEICETSDTLVCLGEMTLSGCFPCVVDTQSGRLP